MNVLIVSYYFTPCNSISSNRVDSFYNSLLNAGHKVTVVTRGWENNGNVWEDYINTSHNNNPIKVENKNSTIWYLPYTKTKLYSNRILSKINTFLNFVNGNFTIEANTFSFYNFTKQLFYNQKFEYVIVSAPPFNIVKFAYKLKKEFPDIKLFVDFRDLQNHITLSLKPTATLTQKVEHFFIKHYFKKWLKKADNIYVVTKPFQDFLNSINIKSKVLLNGFEEKILTLSKNKKNEQFTVAVIGTLYQEQSIEFFIQVLKLFIINKSPNSVKINMIGVAAIPEVVEYIKNSLGEFVNITPKIPKDEALQIGKNSDVLAYPGWKGYKGVYSGKIFEYLAFGNPILLAPTDNDVIEKLILECDAGIAVNHIEDGVNFLNKLYEVWNNYSTLILKPASPNILKYSRENINKILIEAIK